LYDRIKYRQGGVGRKREKYFLFPKREMATKTPSNNI
jgi:hypothetical protein